MLEYTDRDPIVSTNLQADDDPLQEVITRSRQAIMRADLLICTLRSRYDLDTTLPAQVEAAAD
jgi:hypothetical protein